MRISEFLRTHFVGKPPSRNTIYRAIDGGIWQGERLGSLYLIHVDQNGQPLAGATRAGTGNPEADALLREWESTRT